MADLTIRIREDSKCFPIFLLQNSILDNAIMLNITAIFKSIIYLNQERFIEEADLDNITVFILSKLGKIKEMAEDKLFLKCLDHIRYKLFYYKQLYLEDESYEQLSNLEFVIGKVFVKTGQSLAKNK